MAHWRRLATCFRSCASGAAGLALLCLGATSAGAAGPTQQPAVPTTAASQRAVLDQYCVRCHNARRQMADLRLDTLDLSDVSADAEVWEKVLRKLHARAMPPAGAARPDEPVYVAPVSTPEHGAGPRRPDRDCAARRRDPGRPPGDTSGTAASASSRGTR